MIAPTIRRPAPAFVGLDAEELMAPTAPARQTFAPTLADGYRGTAGVVPVGSRRVVAGSRWPDGPIRAREGVAIDVPPVSVRGDEADVVLVGDGRELTGVEVVLRCGLADKEADRRLLAAGMTQPSPEEIAEWESGTAWPAVAKRCARWEISCQQVYEAAWADAIVCSRSINEESDGELVGEMDIDGRLVLGDAQYGMPARSFDVPAGRYAAVVWREDGEVARLGFYRIGRRLAGVA